MVKEHWHEMDEVSFCHQCGSPVELRRMKDGHTRPVCTACGAVVFLNPKVVAGVITQVDGKLVMIKRKMNPGAGRWSIPAGFVDRGETVEEAATREFREESGLEVKPTRLVGVYSRAGDAIILVLYAGTVIGGEAVAGDEVLEVGYFDAESPPPLAFDRDAAIIRRWLDELS